MYIGLFRVCNEIFILEKHRLFMDKPIFDVGFLFFCCSDKPYLEISNTSLCSH